MSLQVIMNNTKVNNPFFSWIPFTFTNYHAKGQKYEEHWTNGLQWPKYMTVTNTFQLLFILHLVRQRVWNIDSHQKNILKQLNWRTIQCSSYCSYVSYWNSLDYHWPGFYRTSTTLVPIIIHVIQAGKLLEFPRLSLAWLLQNYCNLSGDKQFQLADWRIRLSAIHLDLSIILYLGRHFHKWLLSLIISS